MGEKEMRQVYAETVIELALTDSKVVALEADLSSSMDTIQLKAILKERYINVGIMEAEEMGIAAGLAVTGFRPFVHTFAPFATRRAFDQVFLSLGYARKHAVIVGSDPGVTAEMNGGTHMAFEDIALMRTIPGMTIYEVADPIQLKKILHISHLSTGLVYLRTIRKKGLSLYQETTDFSQGFRILREGTVATIFASGIMIEEALQAGEALAQKNISVQVIDLFKIKPLNEEIVLAAAHMGPIVTAENHNIIGGLGSAVAEIISEQFPVKMKRIGSNDRFGQVGQLDYLKKTYGLTAKKIQQAILDLVK